MISFGVRAEQSMDEWHIPFQCLSFWHWTRRSGQSGWMLDTSSYIILLQGMHRNGMMDGLLGRRFRLLS